MTPAAQPTQACDASAHPNGGPAYRTMCDSETRDFECDNNNTTTDNHKASDKLVESDTEFDIAKYEAMEFTPKIRWPDLAAQTLLHSVSLYALYLMFTMKLKFYTVLFGLERGPRQTLDCGIDDNVAKYPHKYWSEMQNTEDIILIGTIYSSGFGITAGVHRLWSHRAYRANLPLRILLALLFTITGQLMAAFIQIVIVRMYRHLAEAQASGNSRLFEKLRKLAWVWWEISESAPFLKAATKLNRHPSLSRSAPDRILSILMYL
ncbi:Acyl-CoA desaturase 4 [Eumeta japonica]|uniref:Acyl-CoA desaturase 4 n=1 Tax=Eumeta variegata TaxID=151549 RepID=A0A4C1XQL3_EUMVA|nr:Acyl-CoA desaturase 4 [Eumeta japonica]